MKSILDLELDAGVTHAYFRPTTTTLYNIRPTVLNKPTSRENGKIKKTDTKTYIMGSCQNWHSPQERG